MASPRSALSAVLTPGRPRPSSTRVMATSGRMPTTTVSASSRRETLAMLASMRPMKLSTISSADMSIITPRARCWTIRVVRSSCRRFASWSCMSTWMVTSRALPILRMGMLSMSRAQSRGSAAGSWGLPWFFDFSTERPVRLSASASASASVALETTLSSTPSCTMVWAICGRMPLMRQSAPIRRAADTVFRRCWAVSVSGRHTGDVDDGDLGPGLNDALEQVLHHHLGAAAVERADQGQGDDALPQLHHRRRQFLDFLALALDQLLARLLEGLDGVEAELVEQQAERPDAVGHLLDVAGGGAHALEQRLLQRKHEDCRLGGRKALQRPAAGKSRQDVAHRVEFRSPDVAAVARG